MMRDDGDPADSPSPEAGEPHPRVGTSQGGEGGGLHPPLSPAGPSVPAAGGQDAPPAPGAPPRGWAAQGPPPAPAGPPPPPPPPAQGGWPSPGWGAAPRPWTYPPPLTPANPRVPLRRRALTIAAMVIGALVIIAAVGIPAALIARGTSAPSTATPAQTPSATPSSGPTTAAARALYRAVLSASEASAGFHYVAVSSGTGPAETITGDAGQHEGTQQLTWTSGFGREQFSLLLTSDGAVYFQGNAPSLEDQLGVVAADAPSLSGRWVKVVVGDGPYRDLEEGITVSSQLSEDTFQPTSEETVTGSGGVRLTRVAGTIPPSQYLPSGATAYLEVPSGSHLPSTWVVAARGQGGTSTTTTTFSSWGKAPAVSAPSGWVAWSTLSTSAPPGGYGQGQTPTPAPTPGGPATTPEPSPTPTPGGSL